MDVHASIRDELATMLRGGHSHMSLGDAVDGFPMGRVNAKPPHSPYSCWHILEHMRIALWDIIEFVRDPDHVSPTYPEGFRPDPSDSTDSAGWQTTIDRILAGLEAMEALVRDPQVDILAPLPHAPEYNIFREALTAAEHMSYHIGELAMMRQTLDAWPAGSEYLTGP
jgi:hypothetical protein